MRKVHGYVLAKQTNEGIANLVVAAFYSELTIVALAKHLRDGAVDEEIWVKFGERIGSVLTDASGRFELHAQDDEHETRSLVLVVFAPEDVADVDNPVPLPPEKRILYASGLPRRAGAEEAYVIRLLQAQLDRFAIAVGNATPAKPGMDVASSRLSDSIEQAFAFRENLTTLLKPRMTVQIEAAKQTRDAAKVKLQTLSGIPADNRAHPQRLTDPAKLTDLLRTTIGSGVTTLNANAGEMTLTLDDDDLAALGLTADASGNISGDVDPLAVATLIKSKVGGVDLVFKQPVSSAQALLQAKAGK